MAVRWCLQRATGPIDAIALALREPRDLGRTALTSWLSDLGNGSVNRLVDSLRGEPATLDEIIRYPLSTQQQRTENLHRLLRDSGIDTGSTQVVHVDHHLAHAASAYFTAGLPEALVITMDGRGDDLSGSVTIGRDGELTVLETINWMQSIGHLYAAATVVCGFRAMRHEGKITGLAAHGQVDSRLYQSLRELYGAPEGGWTRIGLSHSIPVGPYPDSRFGAQIEVLRSLTGGLDPEVVAATVQRLTEDVVSEYVQAKFHGTRSRHLLLAGGLFANVLLNQRIFEACPVDRLHVHPAMSDAGLGAGAALHHFHRSNQFRAEGLDHAFLGPSYNDSEITLALDWAGLTYEDHGEDIHHQVGQILADGFVVARFHGATEYGPRALGNRSILYQATDPTVNDWLNTKLDRTEFMPFAPATLTEFAGECYQLPDAIERTAEFMTITVPCTTTMQAVSPAAVHIDGTARPQLVHPDRNPSFHRVLSSYHSRTGLPSVLNTSFNRHEEPIVNTPAEAVASFLEFDIDYLAIGRFLVSGRGQR